MKSVLRCLGVPQAQLELLAAASYSNVASRKTAGRKLSRALKPKRLTDELEAKAS